MGKAITIPDNNKRFRLMWEEVVTKFSKDEVVSIILKRIYEKHATYMVYVTSGEIASHLDVDRQQLAYARRKGRLIPAGKTGRDYFYSLRDVIRWIGDRKKKTRLKKWDQEKILSGQA